MASEDLLMEHKDEIASVVREKHQIEEKLASAAGSNDFAPMLRLCRELVETIDEVSEMVSKKERYKHAGFASKAKFSRKFYHKSKDIVNFEMEIARVYDSKNIALEQGRRMVSAIKLLKAENIAKAREDAGEFYGLLEMGGRLEAINEALSKKRLQVERARRRAEEQLGGIGWLEKEPPPNLEKVERHEQRMRLLEAMQKMRLERINALEAMPLSRLLDEMEKENLAAIGFPAIPNSDAESLKSFLHKGGLATKTAGQLLEMAGRNEDRLKHEMQDLQGFRREIIGRQVFLSELSSLNSLEFLSFHKFNSAALAYLGMHYAEARDAASRLSELEKTAEEDALEWERRQKIGRKKAELEGVEKAGLARSLEALAELEGILDGKTQPIGKGPEPKHGGFLGKIFGFFKN